MLICPFDTKNKGAGMLLNVTLVSINTVGSGTLPAGWVAAAKSVPKIAMIEPGATAPLGSVASRKLAPLTTEFCGRFGTGADRSTILAMKASSWPPDVDWNAFAVGKLVELVHPVT